MRCDFGKEEIKNYVEGGLSQDKTEEIKNHIDTCDECRRFYGVLAVSGNFASKEIRGDKHFYKRVIENIDKDRYKERKMKYRMGSVLSRISPAFKPVFAAAVFCVIALVIVMNGQNIRDFVGSTFGDSNLAGNNIISELNEEQSLNPTSVADSDKEAAKIPKVFQNMDSYFNSTTVPFYYPAYLPDNGPFRLINFNASTEGYSFDVIRSDKYYPPTKVADVPVSMADQIVSVSASQKPFSPYPTEEQLLEKPPVDLDLDGEKVKSYDNGMEVTWEKGTWEVYAVGHSEQDGIRVAKEVLEVVKGITDLVPGAIRGEIRTAQLGNPMYVTASWTYDGNTWYTLDGRSSPEITVKMLQSIRK